ncbi:hypothetical protein TNCV_2580471 [Trichonephila clavipes]|uniref:Uncharacterized protein n=1 Tax=Trichonephila clavipes TaxID=2585209 RepID=A0A8X6VJ90_TRICX|nr:hypothetical protein TNCV_2580471 [Trichonephila clavipes]
MTQLIDGSLPDTFPAVLPVTTVEKRIHLVYSLANLNMCEALELKAKFVPLPGATASLPQTTHRDIVQTTTVLVVGSFSAWKICWSLDHSATYSSQLIITAVFRRSNEPVHAVQSTVIF